MHQKVAEFELTLKEEQYTRRENLKFSKIPESEDENWKAIIYDVISSLGVNTGSERRLKIDADQLLPAGSCVQRTGTAFGLKEVRLSNPQPTPTRI